MHWFDRRWNAAELYAQFCSSEMERARHDAGCFLMRNVAEDEPVSFEDMRSEVFSEEHF